MFLVAVPLSDENFKENLKEAKEGGADLIELRVDLFSDTSLPFVREKIEEVHEEGLGTILTVRIPEEGGREVKNREEILRELAPLSDYTDVELRRKGELLLVGERVRKAGKKLIVSYHDFEGTPPTWILKEVLREGRRFGGIPKVAVMARDYGDAARLLCVAKEVPGDKVVIAMGEKGKVSRVAGALFGSVISYASLKRSTAPGQLPLKELVQLRDLLF